VDEHRSKLFAEQSRNAQHALLVFVIPLIEMCGCDSFKSRHVV